MFWQHDQNKMVVFRQSDMKSFTYGCSQISSSTAFFKCFCELYMTLCLVYKQDATIIHSTRSGVRWKINHPTCSLLWDLSDICTKTWTSYLNQTRQCDHLFWRQTQARGPCHKVHVHLYTVSRVDKIAAVIVISIGFWRDVMLALRLKIIAKHKLCVQS